MPLLKQSVQVYKQLPAFFDKLREGQAPEKFSRQFLKDLGLTSANWHGSIGLLKGLGFLSADNNPTSRYMDFLDPTRWKKVLAEAVLDAYSDIFVMKREPTTSDVKQIIGKYKSTYNMSDMSADRAARTFLALLELSDPDVIRGKDNAEPVIPAPHPTAGDINIQIPNTTSEPAQLSSKASVGLNYNIQIHLPATKDIEVYNAIFRSLREHIID